MAVIGVDIGGTNVRAALIDKNKLLKLASQKIISNGSQRKVLNQVIDVINQVKIKKIEGIGVGVPSILDLKKGIVYETTNIPSWKKVPLRRILASEFGVPVTINNDANCFALGEKYFGRAKGYDHIVGLILGTGTGSGVIVNGRLYSGHNCGAGEFGEVLYNGHNFEYFCSGRFFERKGANGEEFSRRARNSDPSALEIFAEFGTHVGKLIATILNAVDPQIIVVGGSIANDFNYFRKSMTESLKESTFARSYRRLRIQKSTLKNSALYGAAALVYDSKLQ